MNIKPKDHFYRDDYSVAIADIQPMIDAHSGEEFTLVSTVIYVDDLIYRYHGFKTQGPPTRFHLTNYMNVIIPEIFAHDAHGS